MPRLTDEQALSRYCDMIGARIAKLEAALRKIVAGPDGKHDHESGCPFERFACGIAYDALRKD